METMAKRFSMMLLLKVSDKYCQPPFIPSSANSTEGNIPFCVGSHVLLLVARRRSHSGLRPSCPMAILQCIDSRFVILNAVGGASAKLISEHANDI
jgi:hypothetical protein